MMLEVVCACDDAYLPHTATMLSSLLAHNQARIHLLHGAAVSETALQELSNHVSKRNCRLLTYEIRDQVIETLRVDQWISNVTYYRLLCARILPRELVKVLYLDSDMIVRASLNALWQTLTEDCALAAVQESPKGVARQLALLGLPPNTPYFNAGMMLINLAYWREQLVGERALQFLKQNGDKAEYWDQDALNVVLDGRWIPVSAVWNFKALYENYVIEVRDTDPSIVHFTGPTKPWDWGWRFTSQRFGSEYHKYRLTTPWREYIPENRPGWGGRCSSYIRFFARQKVPANLRIWLRTRAASLRGLDPGKL